MLATVDTTTGNGTAKEQTLSEISINQPLGTPTWIDLGVPDLDRAKTFYRALFGWEYAEGSAATGPFTLCLLRGRRVAALRPVSAADVEGSPGGCRISPRTTATPWRSRSPSVAGRC